MKRTVYWTISLLMAVALTLTGCGAALTDAGKLMQYELGEDIIPSITAVVGEREVTGVESSIKNGVSSKQYTYSSASVYDDLWAYVQKLMDEGWLVTEDIDLKTVPGSGQLGKKSSDEGNILLLSFAYEDSKYAIKISKAKGTIE